MRAEDILVPLMLAEKADGGIRGRTKLQKFVFLLQQEMGDHIPSSYRFVAYDYGPFSKELAEDMGELVKKDFMEKKPIKKGEKTEHRYIITEKGKEELEDLKKQFGNNDVEFETERTVKEWNKDSLKSLISFVYSEYPKYAENSVL